MIDAGTCQSEKIRKPSGLVMYLGFAGMFAMVFAVAYLPQPELFVNSVLFLNIWTIGGLAVYLFCWAIAFYRLFIQHDIYGVSDLGRVSCLYFVVFLFWTNNPLFVACVFIITVVFLLYVESPASYFQRYYMIKER